MKVITILRFVDIPFEISGIFEIEAQFCKIDIYGRFPLEISEFILENRELTF